VSGSIAGAGVTGYGLLGRLIANSASQRQQLDTLTAQAASGKIADTYAGLGSGAAVSLNLRPAIANIGVWQGNIDAATGRLGTTQTAMTQIQSIVADFRAQLNNLNGLSSATDVDTIAAKARSALAQVGNLLDTQDGGVYVFAGQDTANPPIPSPDTITSSGFYTQIATAVSGLAASGAAATAAATLAIGTSNAAGTSPFSAYLSQPAANLSAPIVQVGMTDTRAAGLFASANTGVTSTGGSTTGSYMRDTLRALATIGALSGSQAGTAGFMDLVRDTQTSLVGAGEAMAGDAGVMGDVQASLTSHGSHLTDMITALTAQAGTAEDVDMAATLSNLTQAQTRLQASYQLIAAANGLSLAKFLPAG
jgi:flagellar hook-associated protein 3 FlgL